MLNRIIAVASLAVASLLSSAAMAGDADEAAAMGAGSITTNSALCQGNGECQRALAQCEDLVKTWTGPGAAAALDATRECRAKLNPVVPPPKKVAPTPPVCSGPHAKLVNGVCECHANEDGSGDIDPGFVAVQKFGGGNLIVCLSGHDALDLAREFKRRFEIEIVPNVPGWNTTRDNLNLFLTSVNVPNADPKALAANWNEIWAWYLSEKARQDRINQFLENDWPSLQVMRSTYCPPIPDKPNANWTERCEAGMKSLQNSNVKIEPGVRGGASATRSGTGGEVVASLSVEVSDSKGSRTSFVGGLYAGVRGDHNMGTQYVGGIEVGPRVHLGGDGQTTIDILGYGQTRRFADHGAGRHGAPSAFVGSDVGLRPRLNHCFTKDASACISVDASLGYGPQNKWTGPYSMDREGGFVGGVGIGFHGHIPLH